MTVVSQYSLSNLPELLRGPAGDRYVDEKNLSIVASVHGHPQGEVLQAIHNHVVSYPWSQSLGSPWFQRLYYLLTHKEVQLTCNS
jgi:hypothetical protein